MRDKKQNRVAKLFVYCAIWLTVWLLTQGFYMSSHLQQIVPGSVDEKATIITTYVSVVMVASFFVYKKAKDFLKPSGWMWLYLFPLSCAVLLQFAYSGVLQPSVFVMMIILSTLWQDGLTFGIFQNYVRQTVTRRGTILIVGTMFGFGHLIAIVPDVVQVFQPGFYALFVVGLFFAWLREKSGNVYIVNVLHATFLLAAMLRF